MDLSFLKQFRNSRSVLKSGFRFSGLFLNDKNLRPITDEEQYTVELLWLEHLWDYENLFETRVVRAIEGLL